VVPVPFFRIYRQSFLRVWLSYVAFQEELSRPEEFLKKDGQFLGSLPNAKEGVGLNSPQILAFSRAVEEFQRFKPPAEYEALHESASKKFALLVEGANTAPSLELASAFARMHLPIVFLMKSSASSGVIRVNDPLANHLADPGCEESLASSLLSPFRFIEERCPACSCKVGTTELPIGIRDAAKSKFINVDGSTGSLDDDILSLLQTGRWMGSTTADVFRCLRCGNTQPKSSVKVLRG
jgi:hypothetical protein